MNYKHRIGRYGFYIILIITLFIFVTGCTSNRNLGNNQTGLAEDNRRLANDNQPDQAGENLRMEEAGQPNQTGDNQQAGDMGYKVGDVIKINGTQLTVNEVTKSAGGEFDKPKSGNEYVIIRVTIENTGNSTISYNPYYFKVQNSQGQITDPAFTIVDQDTALESGELAPGGKVSGTVVFEQPKNDPELKLQYTTDLFGQDVTIINLQ